MFLGIIQKFVCSHQLAMHRIIHLAFLGMNPLFKTPITYIFTKGDEFFYFFKLVTHCIVGFSTELRIYLLYHGICTNDKCYFYVNNILKYPRFFSWCKGTFFMRNKEIFRY